MKSTYRRAGREREAGVVRLSRKDGDSEDAGYVFGVFGVSFDFRVFERR